MKRMVLAGASDLFLMGSLSLLGNSCVTTPQPESSSRAVRIARLIVGAGVVVGTGYFIYRVYTQPEAVRGACKKASDALGSHILAFSTLWTTTSQTMRERMNACWEQGVVRFKEQFPSWYVDSEGMIVIPQPSVDAASLTPVTVSSTPVDVAVSPTGEIIGAVPEGSITIDGHTATFPGASISGTVLPGTKITVEVPQYEMNTKLEHRW